MKLVIIMKIHYIYVVIKNERVQPRAITAESTFKSIIHKSEHMLKSLRNVYCVDYGHLYSKLATDTRLRPLKIIVIL